MNIGGGLFHLLVIITLSIACVGKAMTLKLGMQIFTDFQRKK